MIKELEEIDGVNSVIGLEKYIGPAIDQEMIPDEILSELKAGGYEEILLNSKKSLKIDSKKMVDVLLFIFNLIIHTLFRFNMN